MPAAIPSGFSSITPHIIIDGGAEMLVFYEKAFGASIKMCMPGPKNLLMHAQLNIGDGIIMVGSNQWGPDGPKSPKQLAGCSCYINLYVEDTDAMFAQAIAAGAEALMLPADTFWGDRYAQVKDPSGHIWSIATAQEDLSDEQIAARGEKWLAEMTRS